MSNIHIIFAIRFRSNEGLLAIGERVSRVLQCRLIATPHPEYPDLMIMEAETLCLRLRLMDWTFYGDPEVQVYQLRGENIIEPRWEYSDSIDLSEWLLQEFRKRDSSDWYIPTLDELKKEAGID